MEVSELFCSLVVIGMVRIMASDVVKKKFLARISFEVNWIQRFRYSSEDGYQQPSIEESPLEF